MKYRLFAILLLVLACTALCLPAAAEPASLLVLGDSISTGYGLQTDADGRLSSYGNRLADEFELTGDAYCNLAVNGATSADLLAQLPAIADRVKAADTIVISIGGNDVLGKMLNLLQQATATTSITAAVEAMQSAEIPVLADSFSGDAVSTEFDAAVEQFGKNMLEIVALLERQNSAARVFFLTQYNPLNGADKFRPSGEETDDNSKTASGYDALFEFTEQVITGLNDKLCTAVENSKICSIADVYSVFAGHGGALTRIYEADIHPNQSGHDVIFSLLYDRLSALPAVTSATETTVEPVHTTEPSSTTSTPETVPPAPITTLEPLPLDDSSNTVPMLIILGIALLCMAFGLLRMLFGKKKN